MKRESHESEPHVINLKRTQKESKGDERKIKKLDKRNIEDILALTPMQKGMLFHYLKDSQSDRYFEQLSLEISGEIDIESFKKAWNVVIETNEILRAVFRWETVDNPIQIILKEHKLQPGYYDLSGLEDNKQKKHLEEIKIKDREEKFDLREVPFRVTLCKVKEDLYEMIISNHHILYDGWSNGIILKEFLSAYINLAHGDELVKPLKAKFGEFIKWIKDQDMAADTQEKFWKDYLKGFDTQIELSVKRKGRQREIANAKNMRICLPRDIKATLESFVKRHRITLAALLYSAWGLLLQRYNDKDDIVFGTAVSGRSAKIKGIKDIVGLFINTVPLRVTSHANMRIDQLLVEINNSLIVREEHEHTPLVDIMKCIDPGGNKEFFDSIVIIENYPLEKKCIDENSVISFGSYSMSGFESTNYDLTVGITLFDEISIDFSYNEHLFEPEVIKNLAHHYRCIINDIVINPREKINEIELLSDREKRQVLSGFNDTGRDYHDARDLRLHTLFEKQAEQVPNNIAVVFEDRQITYREINKKANQLARLLKEKGVKSNSIVSVIINESIEMVTGILGILEAGGAYLPIDPNLPWERIKYTLQDSRARFLLSWSDWVHQSHHRSILRLFSSEDIVLLDDESIYVGMTSGLESSFDAKSPAYVLYTSGTTGKPKGVLVEHMNIINYVKWRLEFYGYTANDVTLQLLSYCFDGFTSNFYSSLCSGGILVMVPAHKRLDYVYVNEIVKRLGVTNTSLVPGMYENLLESGEVGDLESFRFVVLGGESPGVHLVKRSQREYPHLVIDIEYGPTEAAVTAAAKRSLDLSTSPTIIGNPIVNTQIYILDRYHNPLPLYVPGEIYISGTGVSRGYLNKPEFTQEKFLGNAGMPGRRMYRTGDLARWLEDGNIEFLGRVDQQVKIRGARVELAEIETRLAKYPGMKDAVVTVKTDEGGNNYLCAYVVSDSPVDLKKLKDSLAGQLPDYMIPAYFVPLNKIPLTPNGKLNRKALPEPRVVPLEDYAAPGNEIEKKLVEIWSDVLGVEKIGINHNFFDLGGDSIKTIQIQARMNKLGYRLEVNDIFSNPTIGELARSLKKHEKTVDQSVVTGDLPLTPIQKDLFINGTDIHHFNQAVILYSRETLDEYIVRRVFTDIQKHHDALRITYRRQEGGVIQTNHDQDYPLALDVHDLSGVPGQQKELLGKANAIQASIDLEKGPMMKLGLFHLTDGDRLLIVIHHLVIDAISWRILFEDIETLYRYYAKGGNQGLPPKSDSFTYWAEKLNEYSQNKKLLKEIDYWQGIGQVDVPKPGKDFEEDFYVKDSETLPFTLSKERTGELLTRANEPYNTEINDLLLTGLGLGVKKTFDRKQVLITLEGHGRENIIEGIDISRTIGWFTTTYPVLLDMRYADDVSRQIKEVKETLHKVPCKGIGYGILKYLTPPGYRDNLRFEQQPRIEFNYLGQFDTDIKRMSSFEIAPEPVGNTVSLNRKLIHDFSFIGMVRNNRLTITLTYSKKQYKRETVENLLENYEKELDKVIAHCVKRKGKELTPGDFTYKNLSISEIDALANQYEIDDIYTLSPMQEGMLFHALQDSSSASYLEQVSYRLKGDLNPVIVEKTLNELFKRHDVLRTTFIYDRYEKPLQIVLTDRRIDFMYLDIRERTDDEQKRFIEEYKKCDRDKTFSLRDDVLMRFTLIRVAKETFEVIWTFHHILMDGWCMGIINVEFFEVYNSLIDGRDYRLQGVKPYKTYIKWLEQQDSEESKRYWRDYLSDYRAKASMPTFIDKPEYNTYKKEEAAIFLDRKKTISINKLAAENHVTLNTVIQGVWGIILGRYCSKDDVIFGSVVSGRPSELEGIETMMGLFINTIPIRIKFDKDTRFNDLVKIIQQDYIKGEPHHYVSLAEIQAESILKHELLDHIIMFANLPMAERLEGLSQDYKRKNAGFNLSHVEVSEQSNYHFNIVVGAGDRLMIKFSYNSNVYTRDFILKLGNHIENVIDEILEDSSRCISDIGIISEEEKHQLLYDFNDTETDYPKQQTLHELFEVQVEKTPDAIALVGRELGRVHPRWKIHLTYRELNKRSNQLARLLRKKSVNPGSIVGIMVDRTLDMMVGILGILKSGGTYLPINPDFPENRIASMLEVCEVSILLTSSMNMGSYCFTHLQDFRMKETGPLKTAKRPQILDIDGLPIVDRSLIDYEKYGKYISQAPVTNIIAMQGTRGCPYKCAYCHKIWPKNHVFRSAENIFSELQLYYNMGVRRFALIDDIFNLNIKNSSKFFQLIIDNRMDVQLFFPSGMRGDILTNDYIELIIEAGTVGLPLALETASPRLQRLIGKNLNIEKLRQNMGYICEKHPHVILELYTMHGFPGETEEEALSTLQFIKNLKWIHFPYIFILKIWPNTDMAKLAIENGVSAEAIHNSQNLAYHEATLTSPFDKSFTLKYQADFTNNYFLSKERLMDVLPHQLKVLTKDEMVQKYNSYLPGEIKSFEDMLQAIDITEDELGVRDFLDESLMRVPDFNQKLRDHFRKEKPADDALRVLLLDLSQLFTEDKGDMIYDVVEPPHGLMCLMSYLNRQLGPKINGKIAKSRIDFDNYEELKQFLKEFSPHVIGIRTLSLFRDFFHKTVAMIRHWGIDVPIITGGPYATSDHKSVLQDKNIDLAVIGEGETTLHELITRIRENDGKLPDEQVLEKIPGIAFIPGRKETSTGYAREILMLDSMQEILSRESGNNLGYVNDSSDLAYIVFTSGSTGKPKGVMVAHRNVSRLVKRTNYIAIAAADIVLQLSNYAFDGSIFDIFGALLNGSKLVIVTEDDLLDVHRLSALIKEENITVFFVTTALFNVLVDTTIDCFTNVRHVLFGGERLSFEHVKRAFAHMKTNKIIHVYGPTETTVYATYYYVNAINESSGTVPIGKPLSNTTVYILDKNMKPVPIGAAGELFIGGDGVARGYFHREELTKEKFVLDPFKEHGKLYKTGDLVRWLPDGNIEFLDRIDNQVKLRGFRIELGEIESQLSSLDEITEALVMAKDGKNGDKYLCAYVVARNARGSMDFSEVKKKLSLNLPGYMIPSFFVQLEKMPLTPNGKIDKKALPEPEVTGGEDSITPTDELERKLIDIWADVLNVDKEAIGINANFFELGGHSLKATILVSNLHKELNVKVPLSELFRVQTIGGLLEYIRNSKQDKYASIKPVEKKEFYELSSAQKRLYILQQMDLESIGYNIPGTVYLSKGLDVRRLEEIFRQLIERHESLRTLFEIIDEKPVQVIREDVEFEIEYYRLDRNERESEALHLPLVKEPVRAALELETIIVNEPAAVPAELEMIIENFVRPFAMTKAPLFRVALIRTRENNVLLVDMHHIISDGTSHAVLIEEFNKMYNGGHLPALRMQYKDYSEWQNSPGQQQKMKTQETYWVTAFSGELPVLNLPTDYTRPGIQSFAGNHVSFKLNETETEILKGIARKTDTTLYMVILAIYNILLAKLSGQGDMIVGTPIAARRHADLQRIIGMFVNTLAVRSAPSGHKTVNQFLAEVKARTLSAFENQEYQFEELVEQLSVQRDVSRNPVFDVMFNLLNQTEYSGESFQYDENHEDENKYVHKKGVSKFDITLTGMDLGKYIYLDFEYCTKIFKPSAIERFIGYFRKIISQVGVTLEQKIADIEMVSDREKNRLLYDFNNTATDYPGAKTIHELFAEQVERTPDGAALVGSWQVAVGKGKGTGKTETVQLTYWELNKKSNQLARYLKAEGVAADTIVGIMVERSLEMIVGILGVLKAGGAYLPIDISYPAGRIEYMLKDSDANGLLTRPVLCDHLSDAFRKVDLSDPAIYEGGGSDNKLETCANPDNLAYVIYTSGSTGIPKGVLIDHGGVVNLLMDQHKRYSLGISDTYLLKTPYIFDVSVTELFGWFIGGGRLAILEEGGEKDPYMIIREMRNQRVTHVNFVPSMLNAFNDILAMEDLSALRHLRYLFLAGEALKPQLFRAFDAFALEVALEDLYGPTESTVYASKYSLSGWDGDHDIPIGKPLQNVKLAVVDKDGKLQGIGIPGELCIAGAGLARGYLNQPELTHDRFVANHLFPGEPMYKTGDLARWLPDGNIGYLGRIDNQVKIRGLRIELEEIENQLLKHNEIKEAVVHTKEDKNGNQYLCAYIVPKEVRMHQGLRDSPPVDEQEIKNFLSEYLPDYMIPAYVVQLDRIPLNPSGKVDRRALPEPEVSVEEDYLAPRNDIERKLVEVWSRVLGVEKIGIKSNFFSSGGDSIKTIQIASRMRKAGYKVEMSGIFKHPTIFALSPHVKKIERRAEQSPISGTLPLTPIQEWFFENCTIDHHHFNQAVMFYLENGLEDEAIKAVFTKIQEHHDALRMVFRNSSGEIAQINKGPEHPLSLQTFDFRKRKEANALLEQNANEIQAGIDPENGPLMKLGLFHLDDGDRLLIVIHHLVIDGISWRILAEDMETLYRQYQEGKALALPEKTDSFKLWSTKLSRYADSQSLLKEQEYWSKVESTEVPKIAKDFDGDNKEKDAHILSFKLNEEETDLLLTKVNNAFNTEVNDILLTALGLAIREAFVLDKVLIALEGHGREEIIEDIDINRTIGWFTSLYPVILDLSFNRDLARQVKEVKETLHQVPNKGIGYGILRYLTPGDHKREMTFKLRPQIAFNYLGDVDADVKHTSFAIAEESLGNSISLNHRRPFEIDVSGLAANNCLQMSIIFSTRQYRVETIESLVNHFKMSLLKVISYCRAREDQELTPADFTYKGLSIEYLDDLRKQYLIRDIYSLSPMQEGILFHALYDKTSSAYFLQASFRFTGELAAAVVKQSLNDLVQRHDVLRTAFIYESLKQPLQVVLKEREIDFYFADLRNRDRDHREALIKEYGETDKARGFDLQKDVLMRTVVLQLTDREYELIWSSHHIIMDGWCLKVLISEFFEVYYSRIEGKKKPLTEVKQYREYIKWLNQRDMEVSRQYWRNYLDGYEETTGIPGSDFLRPGGGNFIQETTVVTLDRESAEELKRMSGRNNVTLNTFLQAAWGILLGKYNGKQDVVFGSIVSGRPSQIEGIESMIGLFINTIPVRIRLNKMSFTDLLQAVQKSAVESVYHHHFPLAEIQAESPLKQNLLDHILEFHNLPDAEQLEGLAGGSERVKKTRSLEINDSETFEQTNYDFYVLITLDEQLRIRFQYNANVYDGELVERVARHFRRIIENVSADEAAAIDQLSLLSEEEEERLLENLKEEQGIPVGVENIDVGSDVMGLPSADFDF